MAEQLKADSTIYPSLKVAFFKTKQMADGFYTAASFWSVSKNLKLEPVEEEASKRKGTIAGGYKWMVSW